MSSVVPSRTSDTLSPTSSSALPLGLSEGAKAGIALGVTIAVLLFLILLVLFFFPYRRKQHRSKESSSIEPAYDELSYAGTDREKTAPSVSHKAILQENTNSSVLATIDTTVQQLEVTKGPELELEERKNAKSSLFEPSRIVRESSRVGSLHISDTSIATLKPQAKEQHRTYVEDFIKDNIPQFFEPENLNQCTEEAVLQAGIITKKYNLRPEVASEVMKLAFFDFVILCDDSSSMTYDDQCIPTLKDTLRRVAEFATILEPTGISVRFLNYDKDFNGLVGAEEVKEEVAMVPFSGITRLGQVLDNKIVQPLIIRKVREQKLKKPVLVVIITDGKPKGEAPDCLRNTIRDFGDDYEARSFLEELENDKDIGDMVFCSTENLVTRLAEYPQSSDPRYTAWLIELFLVALGKQTQQQKK